MAKKELWSKREVERDGMWQKLTENKQTERRSKRMIPVYIIHMMKAEEMLLLMMMMKTWIVSVVVVVVVSGVRIRNNFVRCHKMLLNQSPDTPQVKIY